MLKGGLEVSEQDIKCKKGRVRRREFLSFSANFGLATEAMHRNRKSTSSILDLPWSLIHLAFAGTVVDGGSMLDAAESAVNVGRRHGSNVDGRCDGRRREIWSFSLPMKRSFDRYNSKAFRRPFVVIDTFSPSTTHLLDPPIDNHNQH